MKREMDEGSGHDSLILPKFQNTLCCVPTDPCAWALSLFPTWLKKEPLLFLTTKERACISHHTKRTGKKYSSVHLTKCTVPHSLEPHLR